MAIGDIEKRIQKFARFEKKTLIFKNTFQTSQISGFNFLIPERFPTKKNSRESCPF